MLLDRCCVNIVSVTFLHRHDGLWVGGERGVRCGGRGMWPHLFGLRLTLAVQSVHCVGTAAGELGHKYPQIPTGTCHERGGVRMGEGLTFSTGVSPQVGTIGSNWTIYDLQCLSQLSCSGLLLPPLD